MGDVVGCGIDFGTSSVFYTKNGAYIGKTGSISKKPMVYFPAVSMSTPGDEVSANFGQSPFVFSLADYVSTIIEEEMNEIAALPLSRDVSKRAAMQLIRDYFYHGGFPNSAALLSDGFVAEDSFLVRSQIRKLIMDGSCEEAIQLIELHFGSMFRNNPIVAVLLLSQQVIEIARTGDILSACLRLKESLSSYFHCEDEAIRKVLIECCSLFCHKDPSKALPELFDLHRRALIWHTINQTVMESKRDPIDILLRQIVASKDAARRARGNRGISETAKGICRGPVRVSLSMNVQNSKAVEATFDSLD